MFLIKIFKFALSFSIFIYKKIFNKYIKKDFISLFFNKFLISF